MPLAEAEAPATGIGESPELPQGMPGCGGSFRRSRGVLPAHRRLLPPGAPKPVLISRPWTASLP